MDTPGRTGLPLSKTNSQPEAAEHAEIQRLKGRRRSTLLWILPRHSYLCAQSKDLFNQEYKKLFLHLFGNNRGHEFFREGLIINQTGGPRFLFLGVEGVEGVHPKN